MKKYIFYALMTGFFVFLQSSSLYDLITVRGVSVDFILISVCLTAFVLGPLPGEILGFAAGFVLDILSGGLLGISAFTYTLLGFGVGVAGQKVYSTNYFVSVILIFTATFAKAAVLGMLAALFLKPGHFGYFTHARVFLEVILACVLYPLFFLLIAKFERNMPNRDAFHFHRYRQ